MLTHKGRRYLVVAILALITASATFFVVQTMYGSSYDPYVNRADGAYGVCPVESWESDGEGHSTAVYSCKNEEQRAEAANNAATAHAWATNAWATAAALLAAAGVVVIAKTVVVRVASSIGLKIIQ